MSEIRPERPKTNRLRFVLRNAGALRKESRIAALAIDRTAVHRPFIPKRTLRRIFRFEMRAERNHRFRRTSVGRQTKISDVNSRVVRHTDVKKWGNWEGEKREGRDGREDEQ
jgi:hypothetical protein